MIPAWAILLVKELPTLIEAGVDAYQAVAHITDRLSDGKEMTAAEIVALRNSILAKDQEIQKLARGTHP